MIDILGWVAVGRSQAKDTCLGGGHDTVHTVNVVVVHGHFGQNYGSSLARTGNMVEYCLPNGFLLRIFLVKVRLVGVQIQNDRFASRGNANSEN